MKRSSKKYLFIFAFFFSFLFLNSFCLAKDIKNFLSLKNSKVNLRQGPSFEYPIKLIYNKKYLPVKIIGKSETWKKIIDFENNSGWIHISQLAKKATAKNIKRNSILYKRSTLYSKPIAKLEIGRLVLIKKCKIKWCKIKTGNFKGWVIKNSLWGKIN